MADFDVEVYLPGQAADVAVLRLNGVLDSRSVPDLQNRLQELMEKNRQHLIVNCQKLRFLSSAGIGLFLGTLGELEKVGGSLVFTQINQPEVYDAMNLLGFFDVFTIYDQEAEAIQKSQSPA